VTAMRVGPRTTTRLVADAITAGPFVACVVTVQVPAKRRTRQVNTLLDPLVKIGHVVVVSSFAQRARLGLDVEERTLRATCVTLVAPLGTVPVLTTTGPVTTQRRVHSAGKRMSSGAGAASVAPASSGETAG